MRLIDADALMKTLGITEMDCERCEWGEHGFCRRGSDFTDACAAIEDAPTIEPERKMGKWVHGREIGRDMIGDCIIAIIYEGWECSICGCLVEESREPLYKFCPQCGADMRGDENETD